MSDTRNYRLVYPDPRMNEEEPSGGYVEVHLSHNSHETQLNIETAVVLAKLGYQVRLLAIDDSQGMKNPDAYLLREQIVIEFKHNQRPTASAIDNEIRDARRQADYVVLDIRSSIRKGDLCSGVINRMKAAPNVKELWIIWRGELVRLKRKDIFNGTMSRKIQ
ncbi:hypothetical protein CLV58_14331 [Spirosoma oryzae]|uniref:tRNA nuclease CdiA C-terminal domain-containing protein n=2 Tax=Spirosoma oryzae TaxID=1469603 RepID=A0A2T0RP28_9BACT|nr:hypothetical protein CLV58_14331 [Spirosoma oryzae]